MYSYPQPQPHPYQRCHIPGYPNNYNYHPSWDATPKTKPEGPWYPNPMECNGWCNHFPHPAYYTVRPPYSHFPPPTPLHYHGSYPPFAQAYHLPPHYSMEQPRYEYDQDLRGNHCCGCSNKGVKTEECEKKDPVIFPNNRAYPFALAPPSSNSSENIPVELLEESGSKKLPAETRRIIKEIPVRQIEGNVKKSSSDNGVEKKPSSPRKGSKLPPVCLRVDPLPRRQTGNATSRSPKKTNQESGALTPSEQVQVVESEEKAVKKEVSSTDAAVTIQSFYRGFQVRRWEPLKKLKQIAKVREQAGEIKDRIQALQDEKQRVLIGETIMGLLLQLDTIQGLHPSVRDVRKSVAKELVCLQERVDSLVNRKEETNPSDSSVKEGDSEITASSGCMSTETTEYQTKADEDSPVEEFTDLLDEKDSNKDDTWRDEAMENGQNVEEPAESDSCSREDDKPPIESDTKEIGLVEDDSTLEASERVDQENVEQESSVGGEPTQVNGEPATLTGIVLGSHEDMATTTKDDHESTSQVPNHTMDKNMEVHQQGQLSEPNGVHKDNAEPATLTGIVLLSEEDMQPTTEDINESNTLEETEKDVGAGVGKRSPNQEMPIIAERVEDEKKLMEENEKLRDLVGKLLQQGNQQLTAISELNGRVKELERKLSKKKKVRRMTRPRPKRCTTV